VSTRVDEGALFVNTGYLRDHVSKLRAQKKIALELRENVEKMKKLSDPESDSYYKFNSILREIEKMIGYFEKMADSLDDISDEATRLSRTMGRIIEDDIESTNFESSKAFSL
jgi:hypothetical protein